MKMAGFDLRRRFRPPRKLRVTSEGKWFIFITLGIGAAAVNTGNNLLYIVLSMNLSLILVSGLLSEWCIRRVSVLVKHASEAFARRESLLAVTCSAEDKRFPSMYVTVSLSLGGKILSARFPEVPAGGAATRVLAFLPGRRGAIPVVSCSASTKFPFALFEKSRDLTPHASLVAYPEPIEGEKPDGSRRAPEAGGVLHSSGKQGDAVRGARDHIPADPVRDIHWKASAKAGKWMVKERERESAEAVDLRIPAPSAPEDLERFASLACASVLRCEKEGRPYRIYSGETLRIDASGGSRRTEALTFLATIRPDGSAMNGVPS